MDGSYRRLVPGYCAVVLRGGRFEAAADIGRAGAAQAGWASHERGKMKNWIYGVAAFLALAFASGAQAQSVGAAGYVINQTTLLGTLALPGSYTYADSFGAGATFNGGTTTTFYDDITFTVNAAVADSITSTINLGTLLGISGMQARLFNGAGPYNAATSGSFMDLAWGTIVNYGPGLTGTTLVLNPVSLSAGTYTLEIKGTVSGTAGGSYSGLLNVAAIPEPETLGLMIAGLVVLGAAVRLRRR